MNITCGSGDFECKSWKEIEDLIRGSSCGSYDDIWISAKAAEFPCLAILINGDYACVHYFLNDEGDVWQSVGYGDKAVDFISNGNDKSKMPADSVISFDEALQCVKQFYETHKQPDCIEWREL